MQIDWITVAAQIVNFLILVWLLKRFLYRPIIKAMDEREQSIADQIQMAEQLKIDAQESGELFRQKTESLNTDRKSLIDQARKAADTERLELLEHARQEVKLKRQDWQQQVTQERNEFLDGLKHQAVESILTIARRTLSDLADRSLEQQITESFLNNLKSSGKSLSKEVDVNAKVITIKTSYELDSTIRGRMTRTLHEQLGSDKETVYKTSQNLLCGIELTIGDQKLSWSLKDYLDEMEQHMQEPLEQLYVHSR